MEVDVNKLQRTRRLKYGSNALILSVAVLGIFVFLFILVERRAWRFDFTANRSFSLSEQTVEILTQLAQPVQVRAFFRRQGDLDQVYIRRRVDDVLAEYAERSGQVDYKMYDPDIDVEATLEHGIHNDGSIVFLSGERRKDIISTQLFNYPSLEESSLPLFVGESLFTNAILAITSGQERTICFLTGHREHHPHESGPEGMSSLQSALLSENYQVREVAFSENPDWQELCDLLIIAGPQLGLHRQEDQAVLSFLEQGKKLLLMVDPHAELGLQVTLGELRIEALSGVIFDTDRHFLLGPHYPAPLLLDHKITQKISEQDLSPIFYLARPLQLGAIDTEAAYQPSALLETSTQAFSELTLKTDVQPKRDPGDLTGPLILGATVTRQDEPVVVVFGDSDFASNSLIEIPGNRDLFLNSVAWLVGSEEQIAIRPQKTDFRPLILSEAEVQVTSLVVQFVYPGLFLLAGFLIWWRRRSN